MTSGFQRTVLLRDDGIAVTFGDTRYGQCDVPALPAGTCYCDAAAGERHTLLLQDGGKAVTFGDDENGECDVSDL